MSPKNDYIITLADCDVLSYDLLTMTFTSGHTRNHPLSWPEGNWSLESIYTCDTGNLEQLATTSWRHGTAFI